MYYFCLTWTKKWKWSGLPWQKSWHWSFLCCYPREIFETLHGGNCYCVISSHASFGDRPIFKAAATLESQTGSIFFLQWNHMICRCSFRISITNLTEVFQTLCDEVLAEIYQVVHDLLLKLQEISKVKRMESCIFLHWLWAEWACALPVLCSLVLRTFISPRFIVSARAHASCRRFFSGCLRDVAHISTPHFCHTTFSVTERRMQVDCVLTCLNARRMCIECMAVKWKKNAY